MIRRRVFLKKLIALLFGGGLWAGSAAAAPPRRRVLLNRFSVAGFGYYDGPTLLTSLKAGDALRLEAEPSNIHDEFAVVIYYGKHKLGYVPRSDNRHLSRMLRAGLELQCEIERISPQKSPWQTVGVAVKLLM